MLKKLIRKEFVLSVAPLILPFAILVAMCAFITLAGATGMAGFVTFIIPLSYIEARLQNKDKYYDIQLPVTRKQIVQAVYLSLVIWEMACVAALALLMVPSKLWYDNEEGVLPLNFVMLGVSLIVCALCNMVAPTIYFSNVKNKIFAISFSTACVAMNPIVIAAVCIPSLTVNDVAVLNGYNADWLWLRATILAASAALFAALTAISYAVSKKIFSKQTV